MRVIVAGFLLSVAPLFAAEPPAASPPAREWRPLADWYRPDLRIPRLADRAVEHSEVRLRFGDDPRWAEPGLDDSDWAVIERTMVPARAGIFWLRLRVRFPPGTPAPDMVIVGGSAAHEFFWDGVRVHVAGRPGGQPDAEVAPLNQVRFELPAAAIAPGEHVVALRMSTFRRARVGDASVPLFLSTVPAEAYRALDAQLRLFPAMGAGAMLVLGAAAVVFWFLADRRLVLGLIAALCFAAALLVVVAAAPSTLSYSASLIFYASLSRLALTVVVVSLSVAAAWQHLAAPSARVWLLAPLAVLGLLAWAGASAGPTSTFLLWRAGFVAVLAIGFGAVRRRRAESAWVIGGALVSFALFEQSPRHFDTTGFILGYPPLLIGLIAAIALQVRRERQHAREIALRAARLELELLRKTLQPHFLLNTLTALAQFVEESPPTAVQLINDLATEFRALTRLAAEREIALADELALCRTHLRIMSARTEVPWTLETENVELDQMVPPALFLTLIENGFSHQRPRPGDSVFRLAGQSSAAGVRYVFFSPGKPRREAGAAHNGTGLRYVRTRLDESFPGAWLLDQRETAEGWETTIGIPRSAAVRP